MAIAILFVARDEFGLAAVMFLCAAWFVLLSYLAAKRRKKLPDVCICIDD